MDCNKVNIKLNSKGNDVKELQQYLKFLGLYTSEIDEQCGNKTVTAIKKLQKNYNLVSDGIFGKLSCQGCGINGQDISNSNQTIEKTIFKDMITRRDEYIKTNKKEPNICYIDINTKYRYVTNTKFKEMYSRWITFTTKNGREPNYAYINKPVETNNTTTKTEDQKYIDLFSDAVGVKVTSFKQGYNAIKYRKYIGYNNDIYDRATALKRLKNKQGLNCSDISQLLYRLAEAFGLTVHYIHLRCKSGIGHIILSVGNTWVDGAAALSSGKAYGSGWCYNGTVINRDDKWLMTDDGKT